MDSCSGILVTGGAGFIGSHTADRLLDEGLRVVVLDNLCSGKLDNLEPHIGSGNCKFVQGDVRDFGLVKNLVRDIDCVVHLAALISVPESIKNPVLTNDVNVNGTLNLLKACVDFGVKRFVYASSCAVYGNAEKLPIKEDWPTRPESPYGVSKLVAENYVRKYYEDFGLETVCLRYFNAYGPRQVYGDYSGVIMQFMRRLAKGLPLVIFGDGDQTRDFVQVQDVAEANLLALKLDGLAGGTFNIGTGIATTINQLAAVLFEITSKTHLELKHSEPREGDIKHSVADISKARAQLGYNPKVSLKEGLEQLTKGAVC